MQLAVKLAAIRDGGRRHHSCADVEQARQDFEGAQVRRREADVMEPQE